MKEQNNVCFAKGSEIKEERYLHLVIGKKKVISSKNFGNVRFNEQSKKKQTQKSTFTTQKIFN